MLVTSGGSTNVKPETSKSFSTGFIFTPSFIPGTRVSIDYTRIKKENEITTLSAQQIVELEDELPGRIVRGANLPTDPVGYAGVITEMDMSLFNTATSGVEAWDFQADYERSFERWGTLQVYGVATLQTELNSRAVSTAQEIDRVGYADGPLRWRGNIGATWRSGPWTSSLSTQWFDSYAVYSSTTSAFSRNQLTGAQGSTRVNSQMYTDVSVRYTFGEGRLDGAWISAGITNVFDTSPPIVATYDSRAGYSTYGDPRRRSYMISLNKSF